LPAADVDYFDAVSNPPARDGLAGRIEINDNQVDGRDVMFLAAAR